MKRIYGNLDVIFYWNLDNGEWFICDSFFEALMASVPNTKSTGNNFSRELAQIGLRNSCIRLLVQTRVVGHRPANCR